MTYTADEVMGAVVVMGVILGFGIYGLLAFLDKSMESILGRIFEYKIKKYVMKTHRSDVDDSQK